jgi:hypothetical protein
VSDEPEVLGEDVVLSVAAFRAIEQRILATPEMAKGLHTVTCLGYALETFAYLVRDVIYEAQFEGDTSSPLPQMGADVLNAMKNFMVAMVQEETAELLAVAANNNADISLVLVEDGDLTGSILELAVKLVDMVKADEALMAKAGARNSRSDASRIQAIHDNSAALGAACAAEKVEGLEAQNNRLTKAVGDAIPRIEALTKTVNTVTVERDKATTDLAAALAELETLRSAPAMTKRDLAFSQAKEGDVIAPIGTPEPALEKVDPIAAADALDPVARQKELERIAIQARSRAK